MTTQKSPAEEEKRRMLCCSRIINADGNFKKAVAALSSFIESGGYDHWQDVEKFAIQAAKEERESTDVYQQLRHDARTPQPSAEPTTGETLCVRMVHDGAQSTLCDLPETDYVHHAKLDPHYHTFLPAEPAPAEDERPDPECLRAFMNAIRDARICEGCRGLLQYDGRATSRRAERRPFHQCRLCGQPNNEHDPQFLRHTHEDPGFAWCCWIGGYHSRDSEIAALSTARASRQDETGWVAITDGLPEQGAFVLVGNADRGWRCAARHLGGGDFRSANGCTLPATHWMPLPAPNTSTKGDSR